MPSAPQKPSSTSEEAAAADAATKAAADAATKAAADAATKAAADAATKAAADAATKAAGDAATKASGDAAKIALDLLYNEAKKASVGNDSDRFDALINKILNERDTSTGDPSREIRLNRTRVWVSFIMIIGLFVIVALVIFSKVQNGATAYVSLMSGLAGIALGWLFGTGAASNLRRPDDGEDSSSTGSRRARGK
jgi:hypothetical protein